MWSQLAFQAHALKTYKFFNQQIASKASAPANPCGRAMPGDERPRFDCFVCCFVPFHFVCILLCFMCFIVVSCAFQYVVSMCVFGAASRSRATSCEYVWNGIPQQLLRRFIISKIIFRKPPARPSNSKSMRRRRPRPPWAPPQLLKTTKDKLVYTNLKQHT